MYYVSRKCWWLRFLIFVDASSIAATKMNVALLLDLETFIALPCILLILKCVNDVVKIVQCRDVMIQDFNIGALKLY